MLQTDGSHHRWPENRGARFALLLSVGREGVFRYSRCQLKARAAGVARLLFSE